MKTLPLCCMPARLSLSTPTSLDFSIYFLLRRRAEVCSSRRACSALLYCVPRGGCMVGATLVAGHYCVLRDSTAAAWLQWSELARWRGGCLARALPLCTLRRGREPPRNATQQSIKWEETSCSLAESCVALRGCLPPSARSAKKPCAECHGQFSGIVSGLISGTISRIIAGGMSGIIWEVSLE